MMVGMKSAAWEMAAAVVCGLSLPLFADLALVVAGNCLAALRRPRRDASAASWTGVLGIVIPAHNEERMIARTVASVCASVCASVQASVQASLRTSVESAAARAPDGRARILVVAHNCADGTAAAARAAGAEVIEVSDDGRAGKSAALRAGFAAARAMGCAAFAVVDADSAVSLGFVRAMERALAAGAEAAQCRYEQDAGDQAQLSAGERLRMLAFRGMNVVRGGGRAALGCSCGIFGNGFLLTAALLERVPYAASSIAEDAEHHAELVARGVRVQWVEDARVTAPLARTRSAHDSQEARWEGGRLRVGLEVAPRLLASALRGNLSAGEALLAALSLPFSLGLLAALGCVAMPVGWSRMYGAACVGVSVLYLAQAAQRADDPLREWQALAAAPVFAARKLALLPRIVAQAGRRAAWVRTGRERSEDEC